MDDYPKDEHGGRSWAGKRSFTQPEIQEITGLAYNRGRESVLRLLAEVLQQLPCPHCAHRAQEHD